jgi:hypothetical protein
MHSRHNRRARDHVADAIVNTDHGIIALQIEPAED